MNRWCLARNNLSGKPFYFYCAILVDKTFKDVIILGLRLHAPLKTMDSNTFLAFRYTCF